MHPAPPCGPHPPLQLWEGRPRCANYLFGACKYRYLRRPFFFFALDAACRKHTVKTFGRAYWCPGICLASALGPWRWETYTENIRTGILVPQDLFGLCSESLEVLASRSSSHLPASAWPVYRLCAEASDSLLQLSGSPWALSCLSSRPGKLLTWAPFLSLSRVGQLFLWMARQ